jgi:hypothetical protein
MWKNSAESSKPQTAIWRMHIACWIPQATNSLSENVMFNVFHCNNGWRNMLWWYTSVIFVTELLWSITSYVHYLSCWQVTDMYYMNIIIWSYRWILYFSTQSPYQLWHVSLWRTTLFNSLGEGTELKHWHLGFIKCHTSETADGVTPIHHSVQTYHPLISTFVHLLESILKDNLSHTR